MTASIITDDWECATRWTLDSTTGDLLAQDPTAHRPGPMWSDPYPWDPRGMTPPRVARRIADLLRTMNQEVTPA